MSSHWSVWQQQNYVVLNCIEGFAKHGGLICTFMPAYIENSIWYTMSNCKWISLSLQDDTPSLKQVSSTRLPRTMHACTTVRHASYVLLQLNYARSADMFRRGFNHTKPPLYCLLGNVYTSHYTCRFVCEENHLLLLIASKSFQSLSHLTFTAALQTVMRNFCIAAICSAAVQHCTQSNVKSVVMTAQFITDNLGSDNPIFQALQVKHTEHHLLTYNLDSVTPHKVCLIWSMIGTQTLHQRIVQVCCGDSGEIGEVTVVSLLFFLSEAVKGPELSVSLPNWYATLCGTAHVSDC